MHEDVCQFKISVHDLVLDKGLEGIEYLYEELDGFLFWQGLFLFKILR